MIAKGLVVKVGVFHPVGAVADKVTEPLKRLIEYRLTFVVACVPETMLMPEGEAHMPKLGFNT